MNTSDLSRASIGARRSPDTEAAVLAATAELIREVGYAALTIEAVAKRARAGKATIYRWWPSKAHLLLSLYSASKQEMARPNTGSLRGDLIDYVGAMLARWRGDDGEAATAPLLRLLIAEAQMDAAVQAALVDERTRRWHHIDRMVLQARNRGELNPALTPRRAEQKIISLLWYLLLNDQLPGPAETPALVDDILAGMLA